MMPINNFNSTKIKIYSTIRGIKVVDSPIKIQILNLLEGQVSESDIVEHVGKSKSTVSVHLRNLLDDAIIGYKAHPLDRRSKIFYLVANYVGEIYPDRIIYKNPDFQKEIDSKYQLYIEIFRQYKAMLLINGLQLEPVETLAGINIGKHIYKTLEYDNLQGLLDALEELFIKLELGHIKVSSTDPIILKVDNCHECLDLQYNMPICNITKGILKGIFEEFYNTDISVEEVECTSKHDDCCTFLIEP